MQFDRAPINVKVIRLLHLDASLNFADQPSGQPAWLHLRACPDIIHQQSLKDRYVLVADVSGSDDRIKPDP
jgi:hypothetical protein